MLLEEWYKKEGATHAHCPHGCDHPQPFMLEDKAYCARCWFVENKLEAVTPCDYYCLD